MRTSASRRCSPWPTGSAGRRRESSLPALPPRPSWTTRATVEAKPGDLFLLCSDGLTSMVSDSGILEEIDRHRGDLRSAAKALVRAANKGGGEDNITVVFFEFEAGEDVGEQTVSLPPPQEAAAEDADEDTLDELDRVPVVQAAPKERGRKKHPVRRRVTLAILLLI